MLARPVFTKGVENKLVIMLAEAYMQYNASIRSEEVEVGVCTRPLAGERSSSGVW
jgi:hypothetical protein